VSSSGPHGSSHAASAGWNGGPQLMDTWAFVRVTISSSMLNTSPLGVVTVLGLPSLSVNRSIRALLFPARRVVLAVIEPATLAHGRERIGGVQVGRAVFAVAAPVADAVIVVPLAVLAGTTVVLVLEPQLEVGKFFIGLHPCPPCPSRPVPLWQAPSPTLEPESRRPPWGTRQFLPPLPPAPARAAAGFGLSVPRGLQEVRCFQSAYMRA